MITMANPLDIRFAMDILLMNTLRQLNAIKESGGTNPPATLSA
jgi:hypothetical protein